MFKISDNEADGTGTWTQTWKLAAGDEFLLAYCLLKEEGGIAAQDGTMFYYPDIDEFNGEDAAFKKADGMGSNIVVVEGGTYTFTLTVTLNSETNTLEGSIEVDKTADILTSDQVWKVLGGRLSYAQATIPKRATLPLRKRHTTERPPCLRTTTSAWAAPCSSLRQFLLPPQAWQKNMK